MPGPEAASAGTPSIADSVELPSGLELESESPRHLLSVCLVTGIHCLVCPSSLMACLSEVDIPKDVPFCRRFHNQKKEES